MAEEEEEVAYITRLNFEYTECNQFEQENGLPSHTLKLVSKFALISWTTVVSL